MKSFVVTALAICVTIVHADVSHINSLKAPIRQAYIYANNPPQEYLPAQIVPQHQLPQQQQQLQNHQIQYNKIQHLTNIQLPMPQQLFTENPKIAVKSVRRYRPRVKIAKKPIVTKNYYVHTAPEETDEELRDELKKLEEQPRKHINVLFVKTPAETSKFSAVNLAKAIKKEQKTVVYVLSKKTSASDLRDAIADEPQEVNKPDVFFIKYRTPEEAAHAQEQIKSQYDSLQGPSTITFEGESPSASVVGSLDESAEEEEEFEEEVQQKQQPQLVQNHQQANLNQNEYASPIYFGHPYLPPANRI